MCLFFVFSWVHSLNFHRTDDEFADFLRQVWFPGASRADVEPILEAYSSDPAAGSPFDTGNANAISSQYKRIAAVQGDWFFQAQRRTLLKEYASKQPAYSYCEYLVGLSSSGKGHLTLDDSERAR